MKFIKDAVTIDLGGNLMPAEGMRTELWQSKGVYSTGAPLVNWRGVKLRWIPIVARINKTTLLLLRTFCDSTVQGAKLTFTFRPDVGWNVGNPSGLGDVTVNLWSDDWSEKYLADDYYEVRMILRKVEQAA